MNAIPDISVSSSSILIEDLHYRGPLFGLIGTPVWRVRWRCADDPTKQKVSLLHPGQTAGSAELAGEPFDFVVCWRGDLRRPFGRRRSERFRDQLFVTPTAVMQLSEYLTHAPEAERTAEPE